MAEIALVSARKARLEAQANKGDERAKRALDLSNHPDTFLSTVQIGITLIGILTGIFSGESIKDDIVSFLNRWTWLQPYSSGAATAIVVIFVTYLSLVLGELVPKRIGLSRPESIAKLVAGPMRIISLATHPFIWLLTKSSNIITRLFNIKPNDSQVTEEEIKAIISEGTEHGAIEEAEQEIIERVFHLGDRNITSLMTHRNDIIWLDINTSLASAKNIIRASLHSVYPVCEGNIDNIKGILFIKDLYLADDSVQIKNLVKPGVYVPENNSPYQVLERFKETKIHNCFIVDEYGTFLGLITLNDILEAIVGDVPQQGQDEYEIIERKDGSFLADAQLPFYDFLSRFEKTDWMTEGEQEFDTIAGFILHQLERIPKTGDRLEWKGFDFEIIDMDNHRIDKVLITVSEDIRDEMEG
jgi:putative hemolysin